MKKDNKNHNFWKNKMVLITGGTGSFGKEFIKIILKDYPIKRLVVYSRDELKQEEMRTMHNFDDPRIRYFIGDVRDKERLYRAMTGIDVVIHAAALKQVSACEYNPLEAVKTNIIGAANVIQAAIDQRVKNVIALSTDKAVNPVNLYGATKLVAEKLFIQGNNYSSIDGAKFSCVRYGNVLGSRGSVIPLFMHQRSSGTVTITDEKMTRFWLTLEQGVKFVISCTAMMKGGEVFIPKIPSLKIVDLIDVVAPGCKLKKIGTRLGEKVHESLINDSEANNTYGFNDMYVIRPVGLFREPNNALWKKGKKISEAYLSNTNKLWLNKSQLKKIITKM